MPVECRAALGVIGISTQNNNNSLKVHGAGHNDIEMSPSFLIRLRDFIDNEAGPENRARLEAERKARPNGQASTGNSQR